MVNAKQHIIKLAFEHFLIRHANKARSTRGWWKPINHIVPFIKRTISPSDLVAWLSYQGNSCFLINNKNNKLTIILIDNIWKGPSAEIIKALVNPPADLLKSFPEEWTVHIVERNTKLKEAKTKPPFLYVKNKNNTYDIYTAADIDKLYQYLKKYNISCGVRK